MNHPFILSKSGIGYRVTALINTGANGYAFIERHLLEAHFRMLSPRIQSLPHSIPEKGYNGVAGRPINQFVYLNLMMGHCVQSFTPFLVTDLGNHGIILGLKYLAYHKVITHSNHRKLIWPNSYPPTVGKIAQYL